MLTSSGVYGDGVERIVELHLEHEEVDAEEDHAADDADGDGGPRLVRVAAAALRHHAGQQPVHRQQVAPVLADEDAIDEDHGEAAAAPAQHRRHHRARDRGLVARSRDRSLSQDKPAN